jgi:hypothetical protein
MLNEETAEKVHYTTLIYRRNLSFNPQPQNQVFSTHELSKPSNLHPLAVFRCFSPTWPPYHLSLLSHFSRAHVSLSQRPPPSSFGGREANTTSSRLVPGTDRQASRCWMTGASRDAVLPIPPPPPFALSLFLPPSTPLLLRHLPPSSSPVAPHLLRSILGRRRPYVSCCSSRCARPQFKLIRRRWTTTRQITGGVALQLPALGGAPPP